MSEEFIPDMSNVDMDRLLTKSEMREVAKYLYGFTMPAEDLIPLADDSIIADVMYFARDMGMKYNIPPEKLVANIRIGMYETLRQYVINAVEYDKQLFQRDMK